MLSSRSDSSLIIFLSFNEGEGTLEQDGNNKDIKAIKNNLIFFI